MSTFEFFFKYQPIIYEKGRLGFQLLGSPYWFLLVLALAGAAAVYFYRGVSREKWSVGPVILRAATFALIGFMLLRPVLYVSTVLPQETYLAVVIDNSESMNIRDSGELTRAEELKAQLQTTDFINKLAEKFKVRIYRYDQEAERIESPDRLTFAGKRTRTEAATELLRQELGTVPLSGVVLISDGVDNASKALNESIARLESRPIPFYTVGVGSESITRDAEIIKIAPPREVLKESTAVVNVSFRSHGLSGRRANIAIRENGTLLKTEEVTLPRDGEVGERTIELPVKNEGNRLFSFEIQAPDDRIAENNTLDSLITVKNDHPQILYIEGEPRWEYKFLRRAIQDDQNLHLVTLLRSSQNKFYRQGIENEQMLAEGFPTTKEELYRYKGLIFGSIESTFFSQDQLNMVVDFVSNRGGGFMMTGGKNSFAGGRYQNSPIADILPVQMGADRTPVLERLKLLVTDYGQTSALMRLSADASANVKQWSDLPPLSDFNRTLEAKVGGIVLARGQADSGESPILLAHQRYGRGRVMAFTSGSSWRWQMEMDHADQSYEMFWKQMLRWLVSGSPDPVTISSDKDTYLPGESVNLFAEVADKSFTRMNNAKVVARLTNPEGFTETVPLDWTGSRDGAYQSQLSAGAEGVYTVEVQATQGEQDLGSYRAAFQVHDRPVEFYDASLNSGGLRTIADQTSGEYYPLSDLADIVEDAQYGSVDNSFVEERELWDVPLLFMLLCATFGAEWLWRKRKGLA